MKCTVPHTTHPSCAVPKRQKFLRMRILHVVNRRWWSDSGRGKKGHPDGSVMLVRVCRVEKWICKLRLLLNCQLAMPQSFKIRLLFYDSELLTSYSVVTNVVRTQTTFWRGANSLANYFDPKVWNRCCVTLTKDSFIPMFSLCTNKELKGKRRAW